MSTANPVVADNLVTIVGSSYFEPISALLEKLKEHDNGTSSPVQAGYYVNGYASSICLLAVVCLESYVMRVRYINKATKEKIDKTSVTSYLRSLYLDFPYETELLEIFTLRDVIAHNHLWEVSYTWNDDEDMQVQSTDKRSSGDKKYQDNVDEKNDVTRTLRLNVSPIKVDAKDAYTVLHTVWKILLFLEKKNRDQCYVSHLSAIHKGKVVKFGKIIGLPETST